ncbi:MAG: hypothetical protein KatS3mg077_1212 [Candidatus Binatia bacterium]|nr:MAG: hypothetical protein KatS3mg077_1212 [Candidatus Binatia bacterium]
MAVSGASARVRPADLLTLGRLFAGPLFAWCVWQAERGSTVAAIGTALLFAFAAWSDIADGRWARQQSRPRSYGRWLDHGADIAFLFCGFWTYVLLGKLPWWVPASIAVAFGAYLARTLARADPPSDSIWTNRIGHWGGVCNYVLLGALVGNFSIGARCLPAPMLAAMFLAVPLYSIAPLCIAWISRRAGLRLPDGPRGRLASAHHLAGSPDVGPAQTEKHRTHNALTHDGQHL